MGQCDSTIAKNYFEFKESKSGRSTFINSENNKGFSEKKSSSSKANIKIIKSESSSIYVKPGESSKSLFKTISNDSYSSPGCNIYKSASGSSKNICKVGIMSPTEIGFSSSSSKKGPMKRRKSFLSPILSVSKPDISYDGISLTG